MKRIVLIALMCVLVFSSINVFATSTEDTYYAAGADELFEIDARLGMTGEKSSDGTYVTYTAENHDDPRVEYTATKTPKLIEQMCSAPYWVIKYRAETEFVSGFYFSSTVAKWCRFKPTDDWSYLLVDRSAVTPPVTCTSVAFHVFDSEFSEGDSIDIAEIVFFDNQASAQAYVNNGTNPSPAPSNSPSATPNSPSATPNSPSATPSMSNPSTGDFGSMVLIVTTALFSTAVVTFTIFKRKRITE